MSTANASGSGDFTLTLNVPYTIAEITIAITAALGNILVCTAFITDRKLWTVTNYFLLSLSMADVCVGAFAIPCAILTSIGVPYNNLKLCLLMLSILIMLTVCSTLSLLAIAVDRYIAILIPLRYESIMTPTNTIIAIVAAWIIALMGGLVPMMGWHKTPSSDAYCLFTQVVDMTYMVYFFTFTFFALPLTVMLIIYARIFAAVRKQIQLTTGRHQGDFVGKQEVGIKKEIKTASSLFTIIFLFILCWAPLHIMNGLILLCSHCYVPPVILDTGIILSHANSAFNPILYAYKLKSFRNKFKAFFLCRRGVVTPVVRFEQTSAIGLH
ncbi:adenosine receptor A3-like [Rhinophrynus dorsalis]